MIALGERFFFKKNIQKVLKLCFLCSHTHCSLSMPGCQVGGDAAEVSHTHPFYMNGKGEGIIYMMSLKWCISIGPFVSEAFSFQEVTKNTQGRHICIL